MASSISPSLSPSVSPSKSPSVSPSISPSKSPSVSPSPSPEVTCLSDIYDLFMQIVTDYRLMYLFDTSIPDFETYLQSWLEFSIAEFSMCDQSLEFDETTKIFTDLLTRNNKVILATLMMKYWLQKNVNDITQMNLHITDRDFKVASESMNLREKVSYLNVVKEQCSQMLNDYDYKRVDWAGWFNQNFSGE